MTADQLLQWVLSHLRENGMRYLIVMATAAATTAFFYIRDLRADLNAMTTAQALSDLRAQALESRVSRNERTLDAMRDHQ